MSLAQSPKDTLKQAYAIAYEWNCELSTPSFDKKSFDKKVEDYRQAIITSEELTEAKSKAIKARVNLSREFWDMVKRVRYSANAEFGNTSDEAKKFRYNGNR